MIISWLGRHRRPLFIAVISIFLIGTFVGLGGYLFTSRDTIGSVATVGAAKISYTEFSNRVNRYMDALRERGTEVTDAMTKEVKQEMLRDMIVEELLQVKAEELGIVVTDEELGRDIQNDPSFQRGGVFSDELEAQIAHRVFRESVQGYEEMRRKSIKTGKLKRLIFEAAKLTPGEVSELYAKQNKGSLKDFEKEKAAFEGKAQQQRALELINYYLRQIAAQVEIRSYLEQRENGV